MDKTISMTGEEFFSSATVYLVWRNNQVMYVGATKNIYKRFSVHNILRREIIQDTDIIEFIFVDDKTAAHELERELIKKHKPLWNGRPGHKRRGESKRSHKVILEELIGPQVKASREGREFDHLLKGLSGPKLDFRKLNKFLK